MILNRSETTVPVVTAENSRELRRKHQRWFIVLWGLWGALLLGVYYRRLWGLMYADPSVSEGLLSDGFLSRSFFLWLLIGLLILSVNFVLLADNSLKRWLRRHNRRLVVTGVAAGALASVMLVFVLAESRGALPFLREALLRNVQGLLGSIQVLLAALALGALVAKLFKELFVDWQEELAITLGLGLGLLSLVLLLMASLGLYNDAPLLWLIRALAVAAVVLIAERAVKLRTVNLQKAGVESDNVKPPERGDMLWKTIVVFFALVGLVGALAPEIEYDALWYHLWLPKLWLQAGHPVDPVHEYISLYPLNFELLYGAGLVTGGPIAAKLLHYSCYLLTALLVYTFARRFSHRAAPWIAVALFMTAPTVLWEATTAYVDIALAFFCLLSVYSLLRFAGSLNARWLLLASGMAGFALGVKHLALLLVVGEGLGILLWGWLRKFAFRRVFTAAVVFSLIAFALASPWYVRSYVASGNPVFPDLYSVFGAQPPERWSPVSEQGLAQFKARFGMERTLLNMLLLPWHVTTQGYRYLAAFGPAFLLLVPGLVFRRWWTSTNGFILFLVLIYGVLWASPLSSFQGRFLIPIIPLIAILAASWFSEGARAMATVAPRVATIGLPGVVSIIMILNLPPFMSLHEGDREGWRGWLAHVMRHVPAGVVYGAVSGEGYLSKQVASYTAWDYINKSLSDSARVLTFSGGDHFYSNRDRLWSESAMAIPVMRGSVGKDERTILEELRKLKITHILFDNERLREDRSAGLPLAQPHAFEAWYTVEFVTKKFTLCSIRPNVLPQ